MIWLDRYPIIDMIREILSKHAIVSNQETRSWQIVSPETAQSWLYLIQVQQITSERIDSYHVVSKP